MTKESFNNISDLIEAAIRIERSGVEFYLKLYEKATDSKVKDVLNFLAGEEEKHIGTFRKILEQVADYMPRYNYPGEYGEYLNGVAYRLINLSMKSFDTLNAKGYDEALDLAIELEKNSIEFYKSISEQFNDENKNIIFQIIDEEKGHLAKLMAIKENKSNIKF